MSILVADMPSPVDQLAADFLHHMEFERHSSERTLINYAHGLRQFREWKLPFPGWSELTADDFRAYLFALMKREVARATIRLHFAAMRSFFKYLTRRKGWKHNPLLDVQLPKQEKRLPIVLTVKQVVAMLDLPMTIQQPKQAPAWTP